MTKEHKDYLTQFKDKYNIDNNTAVTISLIFDNQEEKQYDGYYNTIYIRVTSDEYNAFKKNPLETLVIPNSRREMKNFLTSNILLFPISPLIFFGTRVPLTPYILYLAKIELMTLRFQWEMVRSELQINEKNYKPTEKFGPIGTLPTWIQPPINGGEKLLVKEILFLKKGKCICNGNHFSNAIVFKQGGLLLIDCSEKPGGFWISEPDLIAFKRENCF